ncbi:hypothetical protein COV13_03800 [Candidatus Woesearchaeota archaeon CG10_big_fil_rev_8_21_14_0_10_32_9]|nr:MAG: hypothetical protein COV13_03800 [Candidatus Woesearchaeota archaeon CG10_big_fil_rev_8_21_14_0_10_32_9]
MYVPEITMNMKVSEFFNEFLNEWARTEIFSNKLNFLSKEYTAAAYWNDTSQQYDQFLGWFKPFNEFLRSHFGEKEDVLKINKIYVQMQKNIAIIVTKYADYKKAVGITKALSKRKILGELTELMKSLISLTKDLHDLLNHLSETYPKTHEQRMALLVQKYKYVAINNTVDEVRILDVFEKDNVFESDNYKKLEKYLLCYFIDPEISLTRIYVLFTTLEKQRDQKRYFLNIKKLRTYMKKEDFALLLRRYNDYIDTTPFELIFFQDDYIEICDLVGRIKFGGPFFYKIIMRRTYFMNESAVFGIFLTIDKFRRAGDSQFKKELLRIKNSLKLMDEFNIKLDYTKDYVREEIIVRLLVNITPDFIKFLVMMKVKIIHNYTDLDIITRQILPLCEKTNYFASDITELKDVWLNLVDNNLKDLHHLNMFLEVYVVLGRYFFEQIVSNHLKILSVDIAEAYSLIQCGTAADINEFTKSFIDDRIKKDTRKVIIYTVPEADHNDAFNRYEQELDKIPKDKYAVHFFIVKSASQLALQIKEIAQRKKIDILIISGHGSMWAINFRSNKHLLKEDFKRKEFRNIKSCFNEGAVCYLQSCSTGWGDDPIAKYVSEALGIPTYAPDRDAASSLHLDENNNIILEYRHDAEKKQFIPK